VKYVYNKSIWPGTGGLDTGVVLGTPSGGLLDIMDVAADLVLRVCRRGRPGRLAARVDGGTGDRGGRAAVGAETRVLEGLVHVLDRLDVFDLRRECHWDWTGVPACACDWEGSVVSSGVVADEGMVELLSLV